MVRLFESDRFLFRRDGKTYFIFDTQLQRNVGDGKGGVACFADKDIATAVKHEMTARVALLKCDEKTRKLAFA